MTTIYDSQNICRECVSHIGPGIFKFQSHQQITLTHPIYVSFGKFSNKQFREQTVLIANLQDFKEMRLIMGKSAFEHDFELIKKNEMSNESCFNEDIVIIWSIPLDIYFIQGFKTINTPCTINTKPLWDCHFEHRKNIRIDNIWKPDKNYDEESPINKMKMVERLRYDSDDFESVHVIRTEDNIYFPCLNIAYFISDLSNIQKSDTKCLSKLLFNLYEHGIWAFICNLHKSLVFIKDIFNNVILDPESLCHVLKTNHQIMKIIEEYSNDSLKEWKKSYLYNFDKNESEIEIVNEIEVTNEIFEKNEIEVTNKILEKNEDDKTNNTLEKEDDKTNNTLEKEDDKTNNTPDKNKKKNITKETSKQKHKKHTAISNKVFSFFDIS